MYALSDILKEVLSHDVEVPKFTCLEDYMKAKCEWENNLVGNLDKIDGINCEKCKNRGHIAVLDAESNLFQRECSCMKHRRSVMRMRSSGLGELLKTKTFDTFRADEQWQKIAKKRCMDYAQTTGSEWLFVGGQSGCGKTHLCTAACVELMKNGASVRYFLWNDLLQKFESNRFNEYGYSELLESLRNPEVIYIDDFLKTVGGGNEKNIRPDNKALQVAFEIVNMRGLARKKTIISSEFLLNDIAVFDRATAGRIRENTTHMVLVNLDLCKNYRLVREKGGYHEIPQ